MTAYRIIKTLITLPFLVSCLSMAVNATDNNLCQKTWNDVDQAEEIIQHLSPYCELESKEQNYKLQAIMFSNECKRFEGSEGGDCFYIRECTGDFDTATSSPAIYNIPDFIESVCRPGDEKLTLMDESSGSRHGVEAYIECKEGKAGNVVLKIGDETAKCSFPF